MHTIKPLTCENTRPQWTVGLTCGFSPNHPRPDIHASGTAIDLNAPRHPLGTNPAANYTKSLAQFRQELADGVRELLRRTKPGGVA